MPDKNPYARPSHFLSRRAPAGNGSAELVPFPAEGERRRRRAGPGAAPAYAELLAVSNFSFLHGASHPEELAVEAGRLGLAGFAVCDRNSLAGVVRAHMAAKEAGVPFAVGCRLVFDDGTPDIAVWPRDRAAYGRLSRTLSAGNLRAEKGRCHLRLADLEAWGEGLEMAVLPCRAEAALAQAELAALEPLLAALKARFGACVRLGAACLYDGHDRRRLATLAEVAGSAGVPLLALGDVLYHVPERRMLQDVLTCIREHVTLDRAGRLLRMNAERHIKPPREMARLFAACPEAVAESVRLFDRLGFSLDELRYEYPEEPTGKSATPQAELERLAWLGTGERYPDGVPDKVRKAVIHELDLIRQLDYAPYFLTVWDVVRFARSRGILCQGRGSAANSAVCYCLGITEVDPDRTDLLFERFVSAERREPPDIDVDFEHERREEVIQYIYRKYGRERAGLAATVITYRARSAAREIGKAFGLSEDAVSALSGRIRGWSSSGVGEEDARRAGLDPADPRIARVLKHTQEIIGFPRHLSQHVGGFVITRGRLDELVPISHAAM
ncbi:MAG TPA: PHP domain-containing protein, partial [Afifellaceae bacterium]|nr:PHP domain-containing protein [Afifellaceae bacterium]